MAMITAYCECGETYHTDSSNIGKKIQCRNCGEAFEIKTGANKPGIIVGDIIDAKIVHSESNQRIFFQPSTVIASIVVLALGVNLVVLLQSQQSQQTQAQTISLPKTTQSAAPVLVVEKANSEVPMPILEQELQGLPKSYIPGERYKKIQKILGAFKGLDEPTRKTVGDTIFRGESTPDALKSLLQSLPVDDQTRADLWFIHFTPTAPEPKDTFTPEQPPRALANGTDIVDPVGTDGRGRLIINNGLSDDAYVLVRGGGVHRQVYVQANSTVKLDKISPCSCQILFASGRDWDGSKFTYNRVFQKFEKDFAFTERRDSDRIVYVERTISLNPVKDGSLRAFGISEKEFQAAMAEH